MDPQVFFPYSCFGLVKISTEEVKYHLNRIGIFPFTQINLNLERGMM